MNIYVSNLGARVTGTSLEAVFSVFGRIKSSVLVTAIDSGNVAGMAWVEMPDDNEAKLALQKMNGAILDGQRIEVKQTPDINRKP
jgi:RNA recognition motif-containing protein